MAKGLKKWLEEGDIKKVEFDTPKKKVPVTNYEKFLLSMAVIFGIVLIIVIIKLIMSID